MPLLYKNLVSNTDTFFISQFKELSANSIQIDPTKDNGANASISVYGLGGTGKPYQGIFSGYTAGGQTPTNSDVVEKFPFATVENSKSVSTLNTVRSRGAGISSESLGIIAGGITTGPGNVSTTTRFSFINEATSVNNISLTAAKSDLTGHTSTTHGYVSGGITSVGINVIEKFAINVLLAEVTTSTDIADLTESKSLTAGHTSTTHGYTSGGFISPGSTNRIEKFPFASDSNSSTVGSMTAAKNSSTGNSSESSGYISGGDTGSSTYINVIEKFPFASDSNSSDIADLTSVRSRAVGLDSVSHGHVSGGLSTPAPTTVNIIERFPFASDANSSDFGDLTQTKTNSTGHQI